MGLAHAAISPVFYFLGDWTQGKAEAAMDPMLGFSAGILSYTVLTGMLPHSGQMLKRKPMAWIGFLAALAAALYLGYMHRPFHGG
jgi:zinc transporter ZupT